MSRIADPSASTLLIPKPRDGARVAAGSDRYLTFDLAGQTYALSILDVTEIMGFRGLTVVPMMPSFIRGVINLRGKVVPVVDMAARFGREITTIARRTSIVLVETGPDGSGTRKTIGIIVDAVHKVVSLSTDDVEPPPTFGAGIRSDFISGMARFNGEFIIILDVSHVLSRDELVVVNPAELTEVTNDVP